MLPLSSTGLETQVFAVWLLLKHMWRVAFRAITSNSTQGASLGPDAMSSSPGDAAAII